MQNFNCGITILFFFHFSNILVYITICFQNLGYGLELTTEVTTKNSNEPGPEIVPREKSNLTLIAGAAAGGTVFLLIVLVLVVFLYHK